MVATWSFNVPWSFCAASGLFSGIQLSHAFPTRKKDFCFVHALFSMMLCTSLVDGNPLYLAAIVGERATVLTISVFYFLSCFESVNRSLPQNIFTCWKNIWLLIMCKSENRTISLELQFSGALSTIAQTTFQGLAAVITVCGQVVCVCIHAHVHVLSFFSFVFKELSSFFSFISTEGFSIPIRMRRAFTWWTSWCFQWKEQKIIPSSQSKNIKL